MQRFAFTFIVLASPAMADVEGYRHMPDWSYGHGLFMIFGSILWLAVLGLIIAGIIWFVRRNEDSKASRSRESALAELDMRFARGEIEPEEYTTRKKLLAG
ncbi:SHOCT domain-containing protein [Leisingera sp. McT4-56]|uniref:SHOCT domain-containing protein n=1 Tax=Leisingera sp. McT4-56 TaxID=2881255 RepID=UPI001CF86E7A|nr:SHOCT domain-containing protein [Leisingera sp. McT4-56]MCB4457882.1 SHOCT domain-containing protein [Leisingera sp. McT4-56]